MNFSASDDFLNEAIDIYKKMMNRRWDVSLLGFSKVRSHPESLKQLEKDLKKQTNAYERCQQIDAAILTEEQNHRQKFPLILKIARIPYALEKGEITEQQSLSILQELSKLVTSQIEESKTKFGNDEVVATQTPSKPTGWLSYYYNLSVCFLANKLNEFSEDLEFFVDANKLLIQVSTYISHKISEFQNLEQETFRQTQKLTIQQLQQLIDQLEVRSQQMQNLQREVVEREEKLKDAEEEKERLNELLRAKESSKQETDESPDEIIYQFARSELEYITYEIVARLEEYSQADHVFLDAMTQVENNKEGIVEKDFLWAQQMYDIFKDIYNLIFKNIELKLAENEIINKYSESYLKAQIEKTSLLIIQMHQTTEFCSQAKKLAEAVDDATRLFKKNTQKQVEARIAMASFAKELQKRLENILDGRVLKMVKLAGPFAQRNREALQKQAMNAIEKEKRQRQQPRAAAPQFN